MMCLPLPLARRLLRRHSHTEDVNHQHEPSHQVDTVSLHNSSQSSMAKSSTKGRIEIPPSEPTGGVGIESVHGEPCSTSFLYRAMPHNESIRLLRLYKGAPADPVSFEFEFARLDDTIPEYEALSYVWGPNTPGSYVVQKTSQAHIPVTKNLHDALKGVRECDRDRRIWADALCINQNDGKEKGTQVRKMNLIYARATCVLVWLGNDDTGDAEDAFGVLCTLANKASQMQLHGELICVESAQYRTKLPPHKYFVYDAVPPITEHNLWRKVMMFFCQAWYTRLWVLQEIVLAKKAIVLWGNCSIPWRHVGAAVNVIRSNQVLQAILETRNLQNAFFMSHLSNLHMKLGNQRSDSGALLFLHLLDIARSLEVTDPRDKIYGLLGFPINDGSFGPYSITPDYTLSASEVYTQVTRDILSKEQNLNVLALVLFDPTDSPQREDYIFNLPSWVPNFNSKTTTFPISNINTAHQYSAGFSRPVCLIPTPTSDILRLKGVKLDSIRAIGPAVPFLQIHETTPYLRELLQWYIDAGISLRTLAETMTAGRDREGHLLSPSYKEQYLANMMALMQDLGIDIYPISTSCAESTTSLGKADVLKAREALWRFVTYRQPFITEGGELGLGPRGAEVGDRVVVLWGGQCPFVIGEVGDDQWLLKGECFVKEWIHGSHVEEVVKEYEKEDTVFTFK